MKIIGLTGGIGMGKSTVAAMLRRMRVPVEDADAAVRRLLAPGGAGVAPVAARFPKCHRDGGIDRAKLAAIVFADSAHSSDLADLEAILHPLLRRGRARFLAAARRRGARFAVLDVPLLFETGLDAALDAVIVASALGFVQRARVLARPGMTPERFAAIAARQMPDAEKRRRADFVLHTGQARGRTLRQLQAILKLVDSGPAPQRKPPQRKFHARNRPRYRNHRA